MSARHLGALLGLLVLAGCGGAGITTDGAASGYRPGFPDFDLDAGVVLEASGARVDVLVAIPRRSLVFSRDSSGFVAVARTSVGVGDQDARPEATASVADTLRVPTFGATTLGPPLVVRQRLTAAPGRRVVRAEVEDAGTGRVAVRRVAVEVPEVGGRALLGTPRLDGVAAGDSVYRPLVSRGVPGGLDSLRARVDVYGARAAVRVRAVVLHLRADTARAEPPTAFTPSPVSLRARGATLADPDTVFVTRQRIEAPDQQLTVQAALPPLAPGVYALAMDATEGQGAEPFAQTSRVFVVRRPGYPRLIGLGDLVPPLAYLATAREWAALQAAPPDSLREAFDRFWGGRFQDRRLAEATLEAFYERVEEANRQFAGHTEGWKTDRGMIYVVFGPPERVEDRFNSQVWTYGGAPGFVFERTARAERASEPFSVWTLSRDRAYDSAWRRALRLWRSGQPP